MEKDRRSTHVQRPVNLQDRTATVNSELLSRGRRAASEANKWQDLMKSSNEIRAESVREHDGDVTAIVYRGDPLVNDYFYALRNMHNIIPTLQTLCANRAIVGEHPPHTKESDFWATKFKGLSFLDIENMELDPETHQLAPEDIRRLNKMFRLSGVSKFGRDKNHMYALEYLIYFASQQFTHPEVSPQRLLGKFQENITAYFDYYTEFLKDFDRDPADESIMIMMFALGKPFLPIAIGTYIPARLNITPSSAIKLYKQRELFSDFLNRFSWKKLENVFSRTFSQAYREGVFPEDLEQYQHYDEDADFAAALELSSYMQRNAAAEQQVQNKDSADYLLKQWSRDKRDIGREIMQNSKKRIDFQISKDYPAENITMIKNRDTFVFVMKFSDKVHLTLELDKNGKLFGVPPSLMKGYPHVADTFIVDLLTPLLEKYKVRDAINAQKSIDGRSSNIPFRPAIATRPTVQEELTLEDQELKRPKRKRMIPITVFSSDPLPPVTSLEPKIKRFVAHTEDEVKQFLGPRISRQQPVVDRVLEAIDYFERGHIFPKQLKDSGPVIRIRVGHYRILLERLGGGNYSIQNIARRGESTYK